MILGVAYNCFEGTELLRYSIKQIRPHVDFILLTYQKFSWYGVPILGKDLDEIYSLQKEGLADKIFNYSNSDFAMTNNSDKARSIEKEKRNISRVICYNNKCTHFLDMDTDEFYKETEFKLAKEFIIKTNMDYSAVSYINYYKNPTYQAQSTSNQKVPFICRIDVNKYLGESSGDFHVNNKSMGVDLTRGYKIINENYKTYLFAPNEIQMHHMMSVRQNIDYKFKVHSGSPPKGKSKQQIADEMKNLSKDTYEFDATALYRAKERIKIVPNYFNIPIWS